MISGSNKRCQRLKILAVTILKGKHLNQTMYQTILEKKLYEEESVQSESTTQIFFVQQRGLNIYQQHAQQNSTDELAEKLLYCFFRDKQNFTLFQLIILSIFIPLKVYFFILQQLDCALTCSHLYRMILVNKSIQLKKNKVE